MTKKVYRKQRDRCFRGGASKSKKEKLSIYHEVRAFLVPTEKRIWFPSNSVPMPPARYMLHHEIRGVRYWILGLFRNSEASLAFSPVSAAALSLLGHCRSHSGRCVPECWGLMTAPLLARGWV